RRRDLAQGVGRPGPSPAGGRALPRDGRVHLDGRLGGARADGGWPSARGRPHVGVELFLDGLLARDAGARAAYLRSLAGAETTRAPFLWGDPLSARRWGALVSRLREGTILDGY